MQQSLKHHGFCWNVGSNSLIIIINEFDPTFQQNPWCFVSDDIDQVSRFRGPLSVPKTDRFTHDHLFHPGDHSADDDTSRVTRKRIWSLVSDEDDDEMTISWRRQTVDEAAAKGYTRTYRVILHDEYRPHDMTTNWQAQIAGFGTASFISKALAAAILRSPDIASPCHIVPGPGGVRPAPRRGQDGQIWRRRAG